MKTKNIDLTQGVIWKSLFLFFLPILAGSFFQQLYITADAVIIGQYVGKTGLASIESVLYLLRLPVNFLVGLSAGATILISQFFGAKKTQELHDAIHTAAAFGFVAGGLVSVVGFFFAPSFIPFLSVPENISPMAHSYVRIYYAGFIFSMVYNIGAGILRAVGNSKTPFYILLVSGVINVLLDLIFIGLFHWGVSGAALATILAQSVSAVLVLWVLTQNKGICQFSLRKVRFHRSALKSIFSLGLPMGFQSSLYPIANMMIQASINGTGTDNIAAWALCGKLDFLIWLSVDSLAPAISTFVAQNYGAGQYERARRGIRVGLQMTLLVVFLISAVLYIWCEPIGKLFINPGDYDVIPIMATMIRFLAPLYFLYVFGEVFSAGIRGAGESFRPMLITLTGTCASRILWILFIVPKHHTLLTIIGSYPVSWALTACIFFVFYHFFKKKRLPVQSASRH